MPTSCSVLSFAVVAVCAVGSASCAAKRDNPGDPASPHPPDTSVASEDTGGLGFEVSTDSLVVGPCKNLQCQQTTCADGKTTSVSGTVYAPTPAKFGAADPLYNAIVYVPNAALQPFAAGVSCDKCGALASGEPLVTALTGFDGRFKLDNVPVGTDIPLVIQIGRWRRKVTIPLTTACTDTPVDRELTRMPRNQKEGDIPQMAIVTSTYDPTECILRKIGIDDSEFTLPYAKGRVHMFRGNGATLGADTPGGDVLWSRLDKLKNYDLVALPCASVPTNIAGGDKAAAQNLFDYASAGGRVFVTDLSFPWISQGPAPWPSTATWSGSGSVSNPASVDMTFPKGEALAKWLQSVKATTTLGSVNLENTYFRLSSATAPAQRWVYTTSSTQTYSFNTPVGAESKDQCGRVIYSSFHVASSGGSGTFPAECTSLPLTQQEKMLEFMLFDLASCVQKDTEIPIPPPPK